MKIDDYYIEVASHQENKYGNQVCGDVFLSKKIKEESKTITVLSDGLGSGIKANVLATMTASMALNYSAINEPIERTAKTIMNTLPLDAKRKINYSTFTILNIDSDGESKIVEYDNPPFYLIRNGKIVKIPACKIEIESNSKNKIVHEYHFFAQKEDRIVIVSDGVTQAGIGSVGMPFGWGDDAVGKYILAILINEPNISARALSKKVINKAQMLDALKIKDDASCAVIYFRAPRQLLICSGPPYHIESDEQFCKTIAQFNGKKIICGGTTAQIVSRELKIPIETTLFQMVSEIPPSSLMNGIDLVTEGILTIGKVVEILEHELDLNDECYGPASDIVRLFLENDFIHFLIGTKVNNAHQDPTLPVELEIRRSVLKKMAALLENKYLKQVDIKYI
ncbi:MAG: SpoIIE family protein phosphatase [Salinivirgaceae bacterium]|nr:SpoIIE family protein phosphatase [Salinivirgaceae bacterium]